MRRAHIFGPVLSRRLGLSLGVDLLPHKECTYNCVYCECGNTSETTITRKNFFPYNEIIEDIDNCLSIHPKLDTITFAGSGEPTLSLFLGPALKYIRSSYPEYTLTVLTNGSLLSDPDVRSDLTHADRVIPTLTSVFQKTFEKIHDPHPTFQIDTIIDGIQKFRNQYMGELILELFIIPGINTSSEGLLGLKNAIIQINPDAIQLNTLDRPPVKRWVHAASMGELEAISNFIDYRPTFIASDTPLHSHSLKSKLNHEELLIAILSRRSSTHDDLIRMTGLSSDAIIRTLNKLEKEGFVISQTGTQGLFYHIQELSTF